MTRRKWNNGWMLWLDSDSAGRLSAHCFSVVDNLSGAECVWCDVAVVLGHCPGCVGHLQDFENDFLKREG